MFQNTKLPDKRKLQTKVLLQINNEAICDKIVSKKAEIAMIGHVER